MTMAAHHVRELVTVLVSQTVRSKHACRQKGCLSEKKLQDTTKHVRIESAQSLIIAYRSSQLKGCHTFSR